MSWTEIKKVNSNLGKPLDTLITEKTNTLTSGQTSIQNNLDLKFASLLFKNVECDVGTEYRINVLSEEKKQGYSDTKIAEFVAPASGKMTLSASVKNAYEGNYSCLVKYASQENVGGDYLTWAINAKPGTSYKTYSTQIEVVKGATYYFYLNAVDGTTLCNSIILGYKKIKTTYEVLGTIKSIQRGRIGSIGMSKVSIAPINLSKSLVIANGSNSTIDILNDRYINVFCPDSGTNWQIVEYW